MSPAGGAGAAAGVIGMLQLTSLSSLIRSSHIKLLFVSCCHTARAAFNSSSPGAGFPWDVGSRDLAAEPGWMGP